MIQGTTLAKSSYIDVRFLDNINSAYSFANTSLLNLLITTHELPARLRSLKHYFFLDQSDFFTHFLDLASYELKKSSKLISLTKLQSLLDLSLRQPGSVAARDPYKEDVTVQLSDTALTEWLMRIDSVSGLDEEALISGAAWNEESPINKEKETDEKKSITGDYRSRLFLMCQVSVRYSSIIQFHSHYHWSYLERLCYVTN
jgi:gamma-tubulin complex component 2